MRPIFTGSGVAIITPFNKDGEIDYQLFSKLIEFQIANKTDAIIVCGTTGEGSTLTVDERLNLFSLAVKQVNGRVPVIGGTGSNSTSFSVELMKEAEKCGIDAHLSVTPYYNKASQSGIVKHYNRLADCGKKPLIVYNVPSRTGVNIAPETYKILAEHQNIIAVKEADTNMVKLQKSIALCKDKLHFYIGNDDLIAIGCSLGCKGVISVLANILPFYTHKIALYGVTGKNYLAYDMQNNILNLVESLFSDINPIPVKAAAEYLFGIDAFYRLPLCDSSDETKEKLIAILKSHEIDFKNELKQFYMKVNR